MKRKLLIIVGMLVCMSMLSACAINMGESEVSSESVNDTSYSDLDTSEDKEDSEEAWTGVYKP